SASTTRSTLPCWPSRCSRSATRFCASGCGGSRTTSRRPPSADLGGWALDDRGATVIERYTLPEMGRVWSEAHKYELWCQVETLVLEAHAAAGVVPADAVEPVRMASPPTPEAVAEIEAVTQHDVIAFLSAWADNTDPREAAA